MFARSAANKQVHPLRVMDLPVNSLRAPQPSISAGVESLSRRAIHGLSYINAEQVCEFL